MQSIRSHDEIEVAWLPILERDADSIAVIVESVHRVIQDQLGTTFERVVDGRGQIGAGNADIPLGRSHDRRGLDRRDQATVAADGPRLAMTYPCRRNSGTMPIRSATSNPAPQKSTR